jgi:hypothetical protein
VELRLAAANTPALNYVPRGESTGRYRKSKKAHRPHQAPPLSGANKLPLGYGSGSRLGRSVRSRSGPSNKRRPRHVGLKYVDIAFTRLKTSSIAASLAQIPPLSWNWFDKRTPRGLTKCDPTRSSPILVRKYWLRHLVQTQQTRELLLIVTPEFTCKILPSLHTHCNLDLTSTVILQNFPFIFLSHTGSLAVYFASCHLLRVSLDLVIESFEYTAGRRSTSWRTVMMLFSKSWLC